MEDEQDLNNEQNTESGLSEGNEPEGAETDPTASAEETNQDSDQDDAVSEEINNEAVQKAINKQHRKFREEERKRLDLEAELQQAKDQLSKFEAKPEEAVNIPPLPDAWDENYEELIKAREEAIKQNAIIEKQNQIESDRAFQSEQDAIEARQKEVQQSVVDFTSRAKDQGIKEADLVAASNRVAAANVSPELANFLLTDKDGPVITAYLADDKNTVELYELASMNPVLVGMKLTEIKQKASSMKKAQTSTPPPADSVSGRGTPNLDDRPMIANAKFS